MLLNDSNYLLLLSQGSADFLAFRQIFSSIHPLDWFRSFGKAVLAEKIREKELRKTIIKLTSADFPVCRQIFSSIHQLDWFRSFGKVVLAEKHRKKVM